MRNPTRTLWAAILMALALPGLGCYPDEPAAGLPGDLNIPLGQLSRPLTAADLESLEQYLEGDSYEDFDFNLPGNDFFLGLHLFEVDPLTRVEQEVIFSATDMRLTTRTDPEEQLLALDLLLEPCRQCYFTLAFYVEDAVGQVQAFRGASSMFSTELQPSLEMDATLLAHGEARCVDDAGGAGGIAVAARVLEDRVRLPQARTAPGAALPTATLDLVLAGTLALQRYVEGTPEGTWEDFATVALSYEGQSLEVHFDSTRPAGNP